MSYGIRGGRSLDATRMGGVFSENDYAPWHFSWNQNIDSPSTWINWDDIKIRVYGDVAVVTFHVLRKSKSANEEHLRVLAVYVKRDGYWRNVAQQGIVRAIRK